MKLFGRDKAGKDEEMTQPQKPPQPAQQIQVQLDAKVGEGIYSNLALMSHSPAEFFIDFARYLPGLPKAVVQARIIMTPAHAKQLLHALKDNIERYEDNFGEIKMHVKPGHPGGMVGFQPGQPEQPQK
jgi:hypothetical protein